MGKLNRKLFFWLLSISLAGLALRLWHIAWGAPERTDLLPDEVDFVMNHALRLMNRVEAVWTGHHAWDRSTLDPVFLNYPSFLMYMIAGASLLLKRLGVLTEIWQFYLMGRGIVAVWGALTIPAVYLLAAELGATEAGALLAAGWAAILPLHVWQSHMAVTDVLMTFWTTVSLWASLRLLRSARWRDFAFAGMALGLATGSKYTAALAAAALVVAALLARATPQRTLAGLVLAGACSLVACFLVTPYSFFHLGTTLSAMNYEHTHTTHMHYGFSAYAVGWQFHRWVYQVAAAAPFSLGFALYAACAAGLLWTLFHGNRARWTVLVFCTVFYGVTGSWVFTPLRYYLPLLIVAVAFAGLWLGAWLGSARRAQRIAAVTVVIIVTAYTTAFSLSTTSLFGHDTRVQAGHWIDVHAGGARIGVFGWSRYFGMPSSDGSARMVHADEVDLVTLPEKPAYDLIQISSLEFMRHYRHGNMLFEVGYDRLRNPAGPYECVARFESHFLNKHLYERLDPMFGGYFISPTLEFYRAKPHGAAVLGAQDKDPVQAATLL